MIDLEGEGMVVRRLRVPADKVVLWKGIVEAHEGLAQLVSPGGGDLRLIACADREAELDDLVVSLLEELGGYAVE